MTLEADMITDRRRLKRRLGLWRFLAVVLAIAAAGAVLVALTDAASLYAFRDHVARVTIDGIITDDVKQQELLRKVAKAQRAKAVILRINSPGGTSTGAEALFSEIRALAEKKPVVAVLGTVAASGGYITALAADHIIARGNTITGSIGVVFQWAEFTELLQTLGVKVEEVRSGPLKARPSPFEKTTEESRAVTERMVRDTHQWFVSLVSKRRDIADDRATELADGRIFTGRQARAAGLVDGIGGEKQAREWLEQERGVASGLAVIDWSAQRFEDLDLSRLMLVAVLRKLGLPALGPAASLGEKALRSKRLSLDGLVSLWHPDRMR